MNKIILAVACFLLLTGTAYAEKVTGGTHEGEVCFESVSFEEKVPQEEAMYDDGEMGPEGNATETDVFFADVYIKTDENLGTGDCVRIELTDEFERDPRVFAIEVSSGDAGKVSKPMMLDGRDLEHRILVRHGFCGAPLTGENVSSLYLPPMGESCVVSINGAQTNVIEESDLNRVERIDVACIAGRGPMQPWDSQSSILQVNHRTKATR